MLTSAAIFEVDPAELAKANWEEVPGTLPVIALAFVFQNVVPVIVTNLEGDIGKVRALSCRHPCCLVAAAISVF